MKSRDDFETLGEPEFWFLTADRREARLFSATHTAHARLHVEQRGRIREVWDEMQHARPSPRAGKNGHTYASLGNERDERIRRFAREVAAWLKHELEERGIPRVHVYAAPRFLNRLRGTAGFFWHESVLEHPLDLAPLTPGELAEHQAVVALGDDRWTLPGEHTRVAHMESTIVKDPEVAQQLEHEHAVVHSGVRGMREEIDRHLCEPGPARSVGEFPKMLRETEYHLRRHFELEETGGFLGAEAALYPMEEDRIQELLGQHRDLEQRLSKLRDSAERAARGEAALTEAFVVALREFIVRLLQHEDREHELLRDVRNQASGAEN